MAEKKRSQSLQEQLDRLLAQSPKPYTAAEEAEIKRGRKGQKEIDEGRATIERRNEEVRKAQEQIDKLNEQLGKAIEFERTASQEDKKGDIADKERAEKEAMWGRGVQLAAGAPAVKLGYVIGDRMGEGFNRRADEGQTARNTVLKQIADDRVKGLTTRDGALAGARRSGVLPSNNPISRVVPRGAAQLAGGAGALGLGVYDLITANNSNDPWLNTAIRAGLGGAAVGAGAGIGVKALERMANPRVPADGASLSIIESPQLRRGGLNQASAIDRGALQSAPTQPSQAALPAPEEAVKAAAPGTRAHLAEQAKALGIKVTTRMGKQEIADAMAARLKEVGGKRVRGPKAPKGTGPAAIAGGLAYAMTPDDAEASEGSALGGRGSALTNAGIAGGAAYGVSRGLGALGQVGRAALSGAGDMMAPVGIDSMTDYSPEDFQQFNDFAVKNLPEWAVPKAAYMAQVPSRNPARPTAGMFGDSPEDADLQAAMEAFLAEAGAQ